MDSKESKNNYEDWSVEELVESTIVRPHLHEENDRNKMLEELDRRNISFKEISEIKTKIENSESSGSIDNDSKIQEIDHDKHQRFKNGANWFYWIAGLSIVNTISIIAKSQWSFPVGLGMTQIIDAFAVNLSSSLGKMIVYIALFLDLFLAGIFVLLGMFANKKSHIAFIIGMVCYSLDALILLPFQDFIGFGFHVFALFYIYQGYRVIKSDNSTVLNEKVDGNMESKEIS